jgi:hypothetical protein
MIGSNPSLTITLCARISPKGGAMIRKLHRQTAPGDGNSSSPLGADACVAAPAVACG